MADAKVLKTFDRKVVRVRIPPPLPKFLRLWRNGRRAGFRNQFFGVKVRILSGAPNLKQKKVISMITETEDGIRISS
jgi:hypothetical protein